MDQTYFYGLGLMLMQHTYFAGIGAGNGCGYSDSVYMPRTCYLLGGSAKKKKVPGMGDMFAVVLAVGGVFLLATGEIPGHCLFLRNVSITVFCPPYFMLLFHLSKAIDDDTG